MRTPCEGELTSLGAATIFASFDETAPSVFETCREFSLEAANGTLFGSLRGTADGTFGGPFTVSFTGTVTNGTGEYAGATGTIEIKDSGTGALCVTDTMSGTIDVPAS